MVYVSTDFSGRLCGDIERDGLRVVIFFLFLRCIGRNINDIGIGIFIVRVVLIVKEALRVCR